MLTRKHIYIELSYSFLMCLFFIPQIRGIKPILLFVLSFAGILIIGCLLELTKQLWAKWFLIIGSVGILCAGLYFSLLHIQFLLVNHGLDSAEPPGSPVAFLLGWAFTTIIFLIPGAFFSFWNAQPWKPTKERKLRMKR